MELAVIDRYLTDVNRLASENKGIAIHAVLEHIFMAAAMAQPKVIVELGVSKEALANKVLAMVAAINDADFWSCDLYDFSKVCSYPKWRFWQGHDLEFAKQADPFSKQKIGLLFVDTDELYEHVREEIGTFFPLLADGATVIFRCTNLQKKLVYKDGSTTFKGWDNERGVIRAIEDALNVRFDETNEYEGQQNGFNVKHWPWGAGLTVLRKT